MLEVEHTHVVVSTEVVESISHFLINSDFLCVIVGEGSRIQHLLYAQLARIALQEVQNLLVRLTDQVGGEDEAAATQSRQNLIGDGAIHAAQVLDLCLALLGVGVHAQHAQYQLLVLHVAVLQQGLEAGPVLCSDVRSDISLHFVAFQLLLQELLSVLLALTCQFLVQVHTAIGRSVTAYFQFVNRLTLVLVCLLDSGLQGFHLLALGLRRTQVRLLNQELDVCLLHLLNHALELVRGYHRLIVAGFCQLNSRYQTVCHLQLRYFHLFIAHFRGKTQV